MRNDTSDIMRNDNVIEKELLSKKTIPEDDNTKVSGFNYKKYIKAISVFVIIVLLVLGAWFLFRNGSFPGLGKNDDIKISVFYSKGVRDNNKKEQYVFASGDPMQIKIDFKNMENGTVAKLLIRKNEQEVQATEIPLSEGVGQRYVTVSPLLTKKQGIYMISLSIGEGNDHQTVEGQFEVQ